MILMNQNQFSIDNLRSIIFNELYLDVLQEMLVNSANEKVKHLGPIFISCITVENFPKLLSYFRDTNSLLIQTKVLHVIYRY